MLQQLDYLDFIDIYHERIKAFHVKDAEFNPTGRQGVYSGYAPWVERAGRFRSLGDGQVDFGGIFSKMAQYGYSSWAVLEWECALKHPEDGAREGAEFIRRHIIRVTEKAFDDFAGGAIDKSADQARARAEAEERGPMAIEGRSDARKGGRIRLGMVGGGEGAFIGAVHRIASRIDDQYELVAGALSSTPEKARRSGEALGLAADRIYDDYESMAKAEGKRADGDRGGRDRHAEQRARRPDLRIPQGRDPRHLRQAADGERSPRPRRCRRRSRSPAASSRSPTITPAIRWCGGCARWCARGELGEIRLVQVRISAGLADRPDRDDRQQAGGVAHRPEALGRGRGARRHRHARL